MKISGTLYHQLIRHKVVFDNLVEHGKQSSHLFGMQFAFFYLHQGTPCKHWEIYVIIKIYL